jgi:hypothetical protein
MVTRTPNLCRSCKHLHNPGGGGYDATRTCDAYPRAIPAEIYNEGADHRLVRPDQTNDIVYELTEGLDVLFDMWVSYRQPE